jgi:hypothetical protein
VLLCAGYNNGRVELVDVAAIAAMAAMDHCARTTRGRDIIRAKSNAWYLSPFVGSVASGLADPPVAPICRLGAAPSRHLRDRFVAVIAVWAATKSSPPVASRVGSWPPPTAVIA